MQLQPYRRRAQYYETDQMAIVHHTNYIRWFEEARIDWMRQQGYGCRELEAQGLIIPVVDASAKSAAKSSGWRCLTLTGTWLRSTKQWVVWPVTATAPSETNRMV